MTCEVCIHYFVCYKRNDFPDFPDRCGDFIDINKVEEIKEGDDNDPKQK